jgi:hypothetical protein
MEYSSASGSFVSVVSGFEESPHPKKINDIAKTGRS